MHYFKLCFKSGHRMWSYVCFWVFDVIDTVGYALEKSEYWRILEHVIRRICCVIVNANQQNSFLSKFQ